MQNSNWSERRARVVRGSDTQFLSINHKSDNICEQATRALLRSTGGLDRATHQHKAAPGQLGRESRSI